MEAKVLTIYDLEALNDYAEEVIVNLRFYLYFYDADGSWVMAQYEPGSDEWKDAIQRNVDQLSAEGEHNYLDFRSCKELRQLSFSDALHMPLETIKEKYLGKVLIKARNVLRRGTMNDFPPVSDEVPDSYLEDLLALRWKENLKLWTIQRDHDKEDKEETE